MCMDPFLPGPLPALPHSSQTLLQTGQQPSFPSLGVFCREACWLPMMISVHPSSREPLPCRGHLLCMGHRPPPTQGTPTWRDSQPRVAGTLMRLRAPRHVVVIRPARLLCARVIWRLAAGKDWKPSVAAPQPPLGHPWGRCPGQAVEILPWRPHCGPFLPEPTGVCTAGAMLWTVCVHPPPREVMWQLHPHGDGVGGGVPM